MNTRLEEAFAQASQLPPDEQEALAALLLDEIASERLWDKAFAHSQNQIAKLADEALKEFQEHWKRLPLAMALRILHGSVQRQLWKAFYIHYLRRT